MTQELAEIQLTFEEGELDWRVRWKRGQWIRGNWRG